MLKKSEYHKSVRRPYPPLIGSIISNGYQNPLNFKKILEKKFCVLHHIKVDEVWYYSVKEIETASQLSFEYWRNPQILKSVKQEFLKREKLLLKAAKGSFQEYVKAYEFYMPALAIVWTTEFALVPALRAQLLEKASEEAVTELMDALNVPLRDNFYKQEQWDLVHAKDLRQHVKKYEWLHSRYGEYSPYTEKQAALDRRKINKNHFLREWFETKTKVKKSIVQAKKLLPKSSKSLVDLMQYIIYYRTHRTDVMNRSHFVAYPILSRLGDDLKISYNQLLHCTVEEVVSGKIPSQEILNQRTQGHAVVSGKGKVSCEVGSKYKYLQKFFTEDHADVTEFKGSIASKGKVSGLVKLIFSTKDFYKIQPGDILVTSMTNPHMLPVMRKAAAFVTDEGGITSHASIIARELKKPCIIGTKVATQVLKDGDLVEVDANNGTVRKLTGRN